MRNETNKTGKIASLIAATALFCLPFSSADASFQDNHSDKKADTSVIELIEEQKSRSAEADKKSPPLSGYGNTARVKEDGFFYLTDGKRKHLRASITQAAPGAIALDSMLHRYRDNTFQNGGTNSLVLFKRENAVDFTLAGSDSLDPALNGFALSLKTSMNLGMPELAISPGAAGLENPFMERRYALGLSMGYSGFNVDTSFLEKDGGITDDYTGVDVGISYRTQNWITRVGLAEYTYTRSSYSMLPEAVRRLYSFELGGAYNVSSRLSLTGGLKLTDFNEAYNLDKNRWSSRVYLSGRLAFK